MRRIANELDLHIVVMLLMFWPFLCLSWWFFVVLILVPQGRIYVRVFWDYPEFGKESWPYFVANELFVFGFVGVTIGLRFVIVTIQ